MGETLSVTAKLTKEPQIRDLHTQRNTYNRQTDRQSERQLLGGGVSSATSLNVMSHPLTLLDPTSLKHHLTDKNNPTIFSIIYQAVMDVVR